MVVIGLTNVFLLLKKAATAADAATDGEVLASPEALTSLSFCCEDMPNRMRVTTEPVCIAARGTTFFSFEGDKKRKSNIDITLRNEITRYEALRTHCRDLNQSALARLHLQMALYVHPVIRDDELALSAQIRQGKIAQPQSTIEDRHLAEAELRSVFAIFIKAVMSPKITGDPDIDGELYEKLGDIMHVVSRELDRYSGHLRQFIVDDKGQLLVPNLIVFLDFLEFRSLNPIASRYRCGIDRDIWSQRKYIPEYGCQQWVTGDLRNP